MDNNNEVKSWKIFKSSVENIVNGMMSLEEQGYHLGPVSLLEAKSEKEGTLLLHAYTNSTKPKRKLYGAGVIASTHMITLLNRVAVTRPDVEVIDVVTLTPGSKGSSLILVRADHA